LREIIQGVGDLEGLLWRGSEDYTLLVEKGEESVAFLDEWGTGFARLGCHCELGEVKCAACFGCEISLSASEL
jgi:hypothetical protein